MKQKMTTLSLLTLSLLFTQNASAEILRWPQLCSIGKLIVKNHSSHNIRAWLQKFSDQHRTETEVSVRAYSITEFNIQTDTSDDRFTFMHFADSQKISATFFCEKSNLSIRANSLEGGTLTFKKSDLSENKLWLQNLYSDENEMHIKYFDRYGKVVGFDNLILNSRAQRNFKPMINENSWHHLKIWGENRFSAFLMVAGGASAPQTIQPQKTSVDPRAAYFLIGPRVGTGDTFIAKIIDPEMIARARELVLHPEYEKMLFAKVTKGHQGYNRNWSKPEKSFWSWSITEVTNFADLGSTACNGIPQLIEDEVDSWIQNIGRICFWNYRIKTELSSEEISYISR